jgi:hypothetical protein
MTVFFPTVAAFPQLQRKKMPKVAVRYGRAVFLPFCAECPKPAALVVTLHDETTRNVCRSCGAKYQTNDAKEAPAP